MKKVSAKHWDYRKGRKEQYSVHKDSSKENMPQKKVVKGFENIIDVAYIEEPA
jgi:hypothetical protein